MKSKPHDGGGGGIGGGGGVKFQSSQMFAKNNFFFMKLTLQKSYNTKKFGILWHFENQLQNCFVKFHHYSLCDKDIVSGDRFK